MNFSFSKESLIEVGRKHWKTYLPAKFKALTEAGTLNAELEAAVNMTLKAMADDMAAGFQQHEAWEMEREHHLILREEPRKRKEKTPSNPAYDALVEMNRELDKIREAEDMEDSLPASGNDLSRATMNKDHGDPPPDVAAFIQAHVEGKSLMDVAHWLADNVAPADRATALKALDNLEALERCCVTLSFRVAHVLDRVPIELFTARSITAYTFGKAISCVEVWVNGAEVTGKVCMSYETILQELVRASALREGAGVLVGPEVATDDDRRDHSYVENVGGRHTVYQQAVGRTVLT